MAPLAFFLFPILLAGSSAPRAIPQVTQGGSSEAYVLRTWEMEDGLPGNTILDIAQTPDGYLWLATPKGLVRFDGVRFTIFTRGNAPELPSDRVQAVTVARNGDLWVGFVGGGLVRRHGEKFETMMRGDESPAPARMISSLAADAKGGVWAGVDQGPLVIRWRNGVVSNFTGRGETGLGGHTAIVHATMDGNIWVSTTESYSRFDGKRFVPVDPQPVQVKDVRLAPARDGGVWTFRDSILAHYDKSGSRKEVVARIDWPIAAGGVTLIYEDRGGNLWMGSRSGGLFLLRDGRLVKVPTPHSDVCCLFEDREGNLWVGTEGGGLGRLRPRQFFLRQTKDGLLHDIVVSICEDVSGSLWILGRNGVPVRALDSTNRTFATPANFSAYNMLTMCPDPAGGLWMGGIGKLSHWKEGVLIPFARGLSITALLSDSRGALWAAPVHGGLLCLRNGVMHHIPTGGGLSEPRALAEDGEGNIWVGTEAGAVFRGKNESFTRVSLPDAQPGEAVRFIVPDKDETLWIGTFQGGLYRWRNGHASRLSANAGLPIEDLRSLIVEPNGDIWLGTGTGLFRVARSELDASIDGRRAAMHVVSYGRNDGLPVLEFSYGFRNATARTRDGHLWLATWRGALEVIPQVVRPAFQTAVRIEEVLVNGRPQPLAKENHQTLPPNSGPVQIRYTLPQLSAPERVRFRYRLLGLHAGEWFSAGNERMATFGYLPPGVYRFEVQAAEADGPWLPGDAALDFTVRAAWWETLIFRVAALLAGASAVGLLVHLIVKRRMQARIHRLKQEHAIERDRVRIARDIHDELGSSLTQISLVSKLAKLSVPDGEAAVRHMDSVAAIARRTADAVDEIVWAVNPRHDTLPSLIGYLGQYAHDFLSSAGIDCKIDMPEVHAIDAISGGVNQEKAGSECSLTSHLRHSLFLAVKEAINNVAKHSGANAATFTVKLDSLTLRIVISDNGRGFETQRDFEGNGLRNMRGRLEELGGSCRFESGAGQGSQVIFVLPLRSRPMKKSRAPHFPQ